MSDDNTNRARGQRTSKTWWVTGPDGTEVKVTGVTSPEEAMAKVDGATAARPLRKFKVIETPAPGAVITDADLVPNE